jgi:hypothetical protein
MAEPGKIESFKVEGRESDIRGFNTLQKRDQVIPHIIREPAAVAPERIVVLEAVVEPELVVKRVAGQRIKVNWVARGVIIISKIGEPSLILL